MTNAKPFSDEELKRFREEIDKAAAGGKACIFWSGSFGGATIDTIDDIHVVRFLDTIAALTAERNELRDGCNRLTQKVAQIQIALEAVDSTDLVQSAKRLVKDHRRVCANFHAICQKYKLGLGGEEVDRLVVDYVDALTTERDEALAILARVKAIPAIDIVLAFGDMALPVDIDSYLARHADGEEKK